jgi:hypothetical membrane protein
MGMCAELAESMTTTKITINGKKRIGHAVSSKSKPFLSLKITAACGILGMLVLYMSMFTAILVSPWFSWTGNALSDLGNITRSSSPIFNFGLIVSGIIIAIFPLGLRAKTKTIPLEHLGTIAFLVAAIALVGVGIFPENYILEHLITAGTMFLLNTVGLFLFGIAFIRSDSMKELGAVSVLLAIASAVIWVPIWGPGIAIPEMIASVAVYILILVLSARLLRGEEVVPKK